MVLWEWPPVICTVSNANTGYTIGDDDDDDVSVLVRNF